MCSEDHPSKNTLNTAYNPVSQASVKLMSLFIYLFFILPKSTLKCLNTLCTVFIKRKEDRRTEYYFYCVFSDITLNSSSNSPT